MLFAVLPFFCYLISAPYRKPSFGLRVGTEGEGLGLRIWEFKDLLFGFWVSALEFGV